MIRFFFTVAIILEYIRSYFTEIYGDMCSMHHAGIGASEGPAEQLGMAVNRRRPRQGCLAA